jgi:HAMP domain-containing protein
LEAAKALLSGETGYKPFHMNNEDWMVFYKPFTRSDVSGRSVQNLDWSIGLIYSESDIFGSYNQLLLLVLACALIGLLAFFVFCRMFTRKELKDLDQLTRSAQRIAKGQYNELIPDAQRDDEIGQLQDNFVKMQHSLAVQLNEQKQISSSLEKRGEYLQQASGHRLETDRLKTAFLYYTTNQMTAPSVIIDNSVTTLCNNYHDISQKDAEQEVEKIQSQSNLIISLLDELVQITELANGKEEDHE